MACFRPAARQLLQEVGEPEKALAMALARVTGFSAVKVIPRRDNPHVSINSLIRRAH